MQSVHLFLTDGLNFSCRHFVRYEGFTVAFAVEMVGLMMLLRINALYGKKKWIVQGLGALLLIETGVNIWLIIGAGRTGISFINSRVLLTIPS